MKLKLLAFGLLALASLTVHAQSWNVTGNAATAANFLGTTNDVDVVFKRFGQQAGLLNLSLSNTAFGVLSLNANTTGRDNTATGVNALRYNTTGSNNAATGHSALNTNNIGTENTAMGVEALYFNTTGYHNTALGFSAGQANTSGNNNSYLGFNSGLGLSTGSNNTILGANVGGLAANLSNTIILADGSGNQRLYINNLGNAGIGTVTPGAKLEVNSGTAASAGLKFTQLTSSSATVAANGKSLSVDATGNVISVPAGWGLSGSSITTADFLGSTNNLDVVFKRNAIKAGVLGANNTSFGVYSLYANTTGTFNTATGYSSLLRTTTGTHNTANGSYSLMNNVGGAHNTSIGYTSLNNNTSGNNNTGLGDLAGTSNTTGSNNSYLGYNTGVGLTTGSNNTILGANVTGLAAGLANTVILADGAGNQRIYINNLGNAGIGTPTPAARLEVNSSTAGSAGLKFTQLTSSSATVAANGKTLSVDATGNVILVPAGGAASGWNLSGNSIMATDFLGSTNNVDVAFKRFGQKAGLLNTSNTAFGVLSLNANTTGGYNTAIGTHALENNTTGRYNTATGGNALFSNSDGSSNIAMGLECLYFNSTGSSNTATGSQALFSNTIGNGNTVTGLSALKLNTTGNQNVAFGMIAGFDNFSGSYNSYLGYNAGRGITSGSNNTILGANITGLPSNLSNTIILADGAGNQRLRIDSTGKTIIGSTLDSYGNPTLSTPGTYKLYVETGILTEKVKIAVKTSANWADHVFAPGYKLMSLEDVDNYISANKHLPGLPSANELVKEGLDVATMHAKQMEKIEELTLYLIEMKKEMANQKQEITNLKKENIELKKTLSNIIKQ